MLQSISEVWLVTTGFGEEWDSRIIQIPAGFSGIGLMSMDALTHGLSIFKATTGRMGPSHVCDVFP